MILRCADGRAYWPLRTRVTCNIPSASGQVVGFAMSDVIPFVQLYAAAVLLVVFLSYVYLTYHYGKWTKLGVPHAVPTPPFGSLGDVVAGRAPLVDVIHSLYREFDGQRYFGIFEGRQPLLVVRDPQLVHTVMVKDFRSFVDRNASKESFVHDKLFDHLVNLRGDQWKAIRAKLSPTFSAAKLKSMLGDINVCTARLIDNLNGQMTNNNGNDKWRYVLRYSIIHKWLYAVQGDSPRVCLLYPLFFDNAVFKIIWCL